MGNSFYYKSKVPNLFTLKDNSSSPTAKTWSVELENTKSLWNISMQSEKISKMLE